VDGVMATLVIERRRLWGK